MNPMTQMLLEAPWKDEVSNKLNLNEKAVCMVLRVGYMNKLPTPISERRDISEIITIVNIE
ncbi:hypothetical protein D3C81_2199320 [compost metagenome]